MRTSKIITFIFLGSCLFLLSDCQKEVMTDTGSPAGIQPDADTRGPLNMRMGQSTQVQGEVTLYQNCNYGGWSANFGPGIYNIADLEAAGGLNDDASSLKVPPGLKITIYEDNHQGGASKTFTSDDDCLIDDDFNDEVSSFVVSTNGSVLWDGDAANGTGIWKAINIEGSGSVSVVSDATYGQVWKFYKPAGSHRTEGHAADVFQAQEGDDIYIGWASKLIMPQNLSTLAIFQWKSYPTQGSLQNHPVMLRTTSGQWILRDYQVGDIPHNDWAESLDTGSWHSFVLRIKVSDNATTGFIEFWYDGVKQVLNNGSTRRYCRTLDSDYCDPKWGVYGGDSDDATNYIADLKIATTYALAEPE